MAKIDIYDLRQANKVYGVAVVDSELHRLAYQLMSIFTLDKGDFVRRSPGSDEFQNPVHVENASGDPAAADKTISRSGTGLAADLGFWHGPYRNRGREQPAKAAQTFPTSGHPADRSGKSLGDSQAAGGG